MHIYVEYVQYSPSSIEKSLKLAVCLHYSLYEEYAIQYAWYVLYVQYVQYALYTA